MALVSHRTIATATFHPKPSDAEWKKLKVKDRLGLEMNKLGVSALRYERPDYSCPFHQFHRKLTTDIEVAGYVRHPYTHDLLSWSAVDPAIKKKIVRNIVRYYDCLNQFEDNWPVHRIASIVIYNKRSNEREAAIYRLQKSGDGKYTRKEAIMVYNERRAERMRAEMARADLDRITQPEVALPTCQYQIFSFDRILLNLYTANLPAAPYVESSPPAFEILRA